MLERRNTIDGGNKILKCNNTYDDEIIQFPSHFQIKNLLSPLLPLFFTIIFTLNIISFIFLNGCGSKGRESKTGGEKISSEMDTQNKVGEDPGISPFSQNCQKFIQSGGGKYILVATGQKITVFSSSLSHIATISFDGQELINCISISEDGKYLFIGREIYFYMLNFVDLIKFSLGITSESPKPITSVSTGSNPKLYIKGNLILETDEDSPEKIKIYKFSEMGVEKIGEYENEDFISSALLASEGILFIADMSYNLKILNILNSPPFLTEILNIRDLEDEIIYFFPNGREVLALDFSGNLIIFSTFGSILRSLNLEEKIGSFPTSAVKINNQIYIGTESGAIHVIDENQIENQQEIQETIKREISTGEIKIWAIKSFIFVHDIDREKVLILDDKLNILKEEQM